MSDQTLVSEARKMTASLWAPSPARAPTDGWMCHYQEASRWCITRSMTCGSIPVVVMAGPERAAASGGSRSTHTACGSIHNQRWWSQDEHNAVSPITDLHFLLLFDWILFLYMLQVEEKALLQLDPQPSPAHIYQC
jgi:hypothetical protein